MFLWEDSKQWKIIKNSLSPAAVSVLIWTSIVVGWTARDRHTWFRVPSTSCPINSLCKACVEQLIKDAEEWHLN